MFCAALAHRARRGRVVEIPHARRSWPCLGFVDMHARAEVHVYGIGARSLLTSFLAVPSERVQGTNVRFRWEACRGDSPRIPDRNGTPGGIAHAASLHGETRLRLDDPTPAPQGRSVIQTSATLRKSRSHREYG